MPLKDKKICVTGGAGFLGRHLLPRLMATGSAIRCLIRSTSVMNIANVEIFHGDCETGAGLTEALRGQDILIHMAGRLFGTGWQDYLRANGRAAENIVAASRKLGSSGPAKIIFVSSLAAAGPCAIAPGLAEDSMPAPVSAYGWSKLLAERILRGLDRDLIILRPPIIYGSGDRGLLPLFKSISRGIGISPGFRRKFPVSVIHADDASEAIILAAASSGPATYHLSDGRIYDMADLCHAMARALGHPHVFVAGIPLPLMAVTAVCGSAWARAVARLAALARMKAPRAPSWNFDKYRESAQAGWLANPALIEAKLGFRAHVTLQEGMAETVAGYRAEGWL